MTTEGQVPYSPEVSISVERARSSVFTALADSIGGARRILLRDTDVDEEPSPVVKLGSTEMPGALDRLGRYQFLGEIARGGMGAVLRGRDTELGRDLAVKVLLESHRDKPDLIRRFVEEAQIGGQLQHPGVVPIYDVGTFADRRPFFTMKLLKGQTLSSQLQMRKNTADGLSRFLAIFEQVCQTMAYAHTRGVIHRDLKPSNIMVGKFGEVQVMDWGLAKVLPRGGAGPGEAEPPRPEVSVIQTARSGSGSDVDASEFGSVLGTPAYMAPEQARGELDRVGERADVFGLGSMLCQMLTGQPAFTGRSTGEVMRKSSRGEVAEAFARLDQSGAEAELIALAKYCLAPELEDRPRSAREVADSMAEYQASALGRLRQAELARVEASARAVEERKRRKLTAALAASIIGIIVVGGGGWLWNERHRRLGAERVDLALREADLLRAEAERAGDDASRWLQAREAAHAVERLAADARNNATREKVRKLARDVTAAATAAENDRKLLDKLVDIRSSREDDPDGTNTDAAYGFAFREAGIDIAALSPEEAGARIKARPASVTAAMAAALDDWARARWSERNDQSGSLRLVEIARIGDPDSWRNRLRAALYSPKADSRLRTLRDLASASKGDELPPVSLELLGTALVGLGDRELGEKVLRDAQHRYPRDVWINYELARCLMRIGRRDEGIRYYVAARSIRPETGHMLAHYLDAKGEAKGAIGVFEDLVRLRPSSGTYLVCLGQVLKEEGRTKEADAVLDRAIELLRDKVRQDPSSDGARNDLGRAFSSKGQYDEAIAEYREGIKHRSSSIVLYSNLGSALRSRHKLEEAAFACRESIRLLPTYPSAHTVLARTLLEQGKTDEAIAEYGEAVRLDPWDASDRTELGNALAARGRLDEAIAQFRDAIRRAPDHIRAYLGLGSALMKQGNRNEGIALFRDAIRLKPDNAEAHQYLGSALANLGNKSAAIAELREVVRLKPGDASAHNSLGLALVARRKLDEAIAAYREAIRLDPKESIVRVNLGIALEQKGEYELSMASFREAIRLAPDDDSPHVALGKVLFDPVNDYQGASAEFREATRLAPKVAVAHADLGNALFRLGKLDEAAAELREAIRLNPWFPGAHNSLGSLLCDGKQDYAGATAEFRLAIRLEPTDAGTHHNLGIALSNQGKFDEATTEFREATRLKPDDADSHGRLGELLVKLGKLREAEGALRESIRIKRDVQSLTRLAVALKDEGRMAEAVATIRDAVRLKPDSAWAHSSLGLMLASQGMLAQGVEECRMATRLEPDNAAFHSNLGTLLFNQAGDYSGAAAEFREAIRLHPNSAQYHYHLGNAVSSLGKPDDAIAAYRKATELDRGHAEAHCNLGQLLREKGLYVEALAEYRVGHEFGSKRPGWPYPSEAWVRDCEQMVAIEKKLPAILRGEAKPANAAERVAIAQFCYDKQLHATAARFWTEAFQAEAKLADDMTAQNRYTAACSAALAGASKSKEDPPPSAEAQGKLRQQALDWLRADRGYWSTTAEGGSPQSMAAVIRTLQHWKTDPDLAGIRDTDALERLSDAERTALRAFWSEVEATLKRAIARVAKG